MVAIFVLLSACAGPERCEPGGDSSSTPGGSTTLSTVPDTASGSGLDSAATTDSNYTPPPQNCEVGTGEQAFIPLTDGAEVPISQGQQGGYHVFTSVRVHDIAPGVFGLRATVALAADGSMLGDGITLFQEYPATGGDIDAVGLTNFLTDPNDARDQEVIVAVDVVDAKGAVCHDERTVIAR
jgi:hypothetical protein